MGVIAVVVAGGPLDIAWPGSFPPTGSSFDAVVAVDGGLDAALAADIVPTVLLGDLDSVSPAGLAWAREREIPIVRHPVDKDDTDTALALEYVGSSADLTQTDILVLGASTIDRFDHLLGTMIALGSSELASARSVSAQIGRTQVHVLHPGARRSLHIGVGRTLSLLALHGTCPGVHITGVRWPLTDHTLTVASTLGISNETMVDTVTVAVGTGVLTVVVPPATPSSSQSGATPS